MKYKMIYRPWLAQAFKTYFDGTGVIDPPADPPAPPPAAPPIVPDAPKTYTQAQIDEMVTKRVKNLKAEQQKTLSELQKIQQSVNLTQEERDTLQSQVETLQSQLMTKAELAAQDAKKAKEKYDMELKANKEEAERWRNKFTNSTVTQALTSAAVANDALVPDQIIGLLKGNTRLVEATDEKGKLTGEFIPMVKLDGVDVEGKPIKLDLPVGDAVKQMKEMPTYGNLFKSGAVGGVGGTNTPGAGGSKVMTEEMLKDPAAYRAWRKKNPQGLENL